MCLPKYFCGSGLFKWLLLNKIQMPSLHKASWCLCPWKMPLSLINPSEVVAGHSLGLPGTCNRWFGPANTSKKRLPSSPTSQEDHCATKMSPKRLIFPANQSLSNTFSVLALLGYWGGTSVVPLICEKTRSLMLNSCVSSGKILAIFMLWILADPFWNHFIFLKGRKLTKASLKRRSHCFLVVVSVFSMFKQQSTSFLRQAHGIHSVVCKVDFSTGHCPYNHIITYLLVSWKKATQKQPSVEVPHWKEEIMILPALTWNNAHKCTFT